VSFAIRDIHPKNPFIFAPLDGYSDLPYRLICRERGAGYCYTEIIPAIAIVHRGRDARLRLKSTPDDRPLTVQLAGNDPEVMAEAARMVEAGGADAVDLNSGCPSRRVTGSGSGAALLSDIPLLERILTAMRKAIRVPLTLKVRSGPTSMQNVLEDVARVIANTGVEAVTLHPRSRAQGFSGRSDWSLIRQFKSMVNVPVIGNGDVTTAAEGMAMMHETGCDAIMVGRAAIGNPWIFRDLVAAWKGEPLPETPSRKEVYQTVLRHYDLMLDYLGGDAEGAGKRFRKHLSAYVRGMPGAISLRRGLNGVVSRPSLLAVLSQVFVEIPGSPGQFE